jgi:hypothetical protein
VWFYRGNIATPKWKDIDTGESRLTTIRFGSSMNLSINCRQLHTIEADLSRVPLLPRPKATGKGTFYRVDYDIVYLFGMTELKCGPSSNR